jgi:hypothetical protein
MFKNLAGNTPAEQSRQPRLPLRPENDEIGGPVSSGRKDLSRRISLPDGRIGA